MMEEVTIARKMPEYYVQIVAVVMLNDGVGDRGGRGPSSHSDILRSHGGQIIRQK